MTTASEVGPAVPEGVGEPDPVNEEIRVFMLRRRLNSTDLAHVLDVSQPQASARLNGRVEWKLSELRKVADLLGVRLGELVDAHLSVSA